MEVKVIPSNPSYIENMFDEAEMGLINVMIALQPVTLISSGLFHSGGVYEGYYCLPCEVWLLSYQLFIKICLYFRISNR